MLTPHYLGPIDALLCVPGPTGATRQCVLVFVTRYSGNIYIREEYDVWVGEKYAAGNVRIAPEANGHKIHDAEYAARTLVHGENPPKPAGLFEDRGGHFTEATVYCDDLLLCPHCGHFRVRGPEESVRCLLHAQTDKAKIELYQLRRYTPEYRVESCEMDFCHAHGKEFRKECGPRVSPLISVFTM